GTKELHMAPYRRLTLMEREEFSRLLAAGYSATAQALHRAPSTHIVRGSPENLRSIPVFAERCGGCSLVAGRPNRLPTGYDSGILMTRRCASRTKPSTPICMCCPA